MAKYNVYFNSGNVYMATVEAENEGSAEAKAMEVIFDSGNNFKDFLRYYEGPELGRVEMVDDDAEVDEVGPLAA